MSTSIHHAVQGQAIVKAARQYLDVAFDHQGRSKHGVDCVGLLQGVAARLGLPHVDCADYSRNPSPRNLLKVLQQSCSRVSGQDELQLERDDGIDVDAIEPGLIVLFSFRRSYVPRHAAISSGPRRILHACADPGIERVIEERMREHYAASVHSTWRYR